MGVLAVSKVPPEGSTVTVGVPGIDVVLVMGKLLAQGDHDSPNFR